MIPLEWVAVYKQRPKCTVYARVRKVHLIAIKYKNQNFQLSPLRDMAHLFQIMNIFSCMISIIIVGYILIKEVIRRQNKKSAIKENETTPKLESYLNKISFTTIFICLIKSLTLLLFQIPGLCQYINPKTDIPIMAIRISFTFYQITRFSYCFREPLIAIFNNKCKYYLHIIIPYSIGCLILFSSIVSRIFFIKIIPKGTYGCILVPGRPIMGVITFCVYYVWDLSVLIVYAKKLRNLNQLQNKNEHTETYTWRYEKIRKFLHKMLFLTISMEIISFICVPMATFLLSAFFAKQAYFLWYIFWNIEIISTSFIQYLMIIPNNEKYQSCIKQCAKYKYCCLCRSNFVNKSV